MGSQQPSSYYDALCQGYSALSASYRASRMLPVFVRTLQFMELIIKQKFIPPQPAILEIGSGLGLFASFIHDQGYSNYLGFDFSPIAVRIAQSNSTQKFIVHNALSPLPHTISFSPDITISHQFLEHINDDLSIINHLPPSMYFIFSVPDFDDPAHVRHFLNPNHVLSRYSNLDIIKYSFIDHIHLFLAKKKA